MRSRDVEKHTARQAEQGLGMVEHAHPLELRSNRRGFLKIIGGASSALLLGNDGLCAGNDSPASWFLDTETGKSWRVDDAVRWSLCNAHHPILGRARRGLLKLTPADGARVVRLVIRRCKLNLFQLMPGLVAVHYWGQQGLGDLRPFFKTHRLTEPSVHVALADRKRETRTVQCGEDFRYGNQLPMDWPLEVYLEKWENRFRGESDDWTVAPETRSGYGWEGIEGERIPWTALKSVWRRGRAILCPNCEERTLLTNFGSPQTGFLSRSSRLIFVCAKCRRSFTDCTIADMQEWIIQNLDADVRPEYEVFWGRRRISPL